MRILEFGFFLISLIEEYLQKWDNLSNEIKHIHNNNITLLNEINVERNHLCSDLNVNFDERKEMSTQILFYFKNSLPRSNCIMHVQF